MPRLPHGTVITESAVRQARQDAVNSMNALALAAVPPPTLHRFDYLFPSLQSDPDALLPETNPKQTVDRLRALADTMADDNEGPDSAIPAAYTYFGQFVDHDITLEAHTDPNVDTLAQILDDNLKPLSQAEAQSVVTNQRTATFDLDSVYGSDAPRDPDDDRKLKVGEVSDAGADVAPTKRPDGKGDKNDVPRLGRNADKAFDRAAQIGDPRNDENTVISQMQVAFLKAHNRLIDEGFNFEQARSILRQHYQHIVIGDFLRERIADPAVVDDILANGNEWFDALSEPFFMPFEFSVAAYRFGHTMVRAAYDFNENFNLDAIPASLEFLFTFTALSGQLGNNQIGEFDTLPDNWIIEWERILGEDLPAGGLARPIDTRISAKIGDAPKALFNLRTLEGQTQPGLAARLASRNLLRGYLMRMPTGQAVAELLKVAVLTERQLLDALGSDAIARNQEDALRDGEFLDRTPLWFYVLAEAAHQRNVAAADGEPTDHLGPVGSTIVAEVLIGLVRRSADSILRTPGWRAALPSKDPEKFELQDLLRFAGVLNETVELKTHVVKSGDSLSKIAKKHLGSANRWPEIFAANRVIVANPDHIVPDMRLIIPSGPPDPTLRFIVVKRGDTLSALAKKHLGDADRWPEIFKLNAGVLTNPDRIVVGQVLQVPAS